MMKPVVLAVAATVIMSTSASAGLQAFGFSMKRGSPEVSGVFVVEGYSPTQMVKMMSAYCKNGRVQDLAYVGKPRKRKGLVLQKFTATCASGHLDRFKGKRSSYEIEYITKAGEYQNKHLVEITTSDGAGNILYLRETIRP